MLKELFFEKEYLYRAFSGTMLPKKNYILALSVFGDSLRYETYENLVFIEVRPGHASCRFFNGCGFV
jgi:hypothetical protein